MYPIWRSCGAWCRSRMLLSRTRDMAIREASSLGRHSMLPAGSRGPAVGAEPGRPNVPVMGFSLQQRYQISERDIPQRLAVYHGTRGGGLAQGGGNSRVPLPRRAHRP